MVYALIDYSNGTWLAAPLNDFTFRYYDPSKEWAQRKKLDQLREIGTDGAALDRLKAKVHREACEHELGTNAVVKYVYTNHCWDYYQRLLKEHHGQRPAS